jgi:hypothetical protein
MKSHISTILIFLLLTTSLIGWAFIPGVGLVRAGSASPEPFTHQHFNVLENMIDQSVSRMGVSPYRNPTNPICAISSSSPNANTDCEGSNPHNETSIAVNPTNPLNIIGGSNDYQEIDSGIYDYITAYSRAHVTFDGGRTWTMVPIRHNSYPGAGDPAVAFDASGTAYMANVAFTWSQGLGCCTNGDIVVSTSKDGGKNWSDDVLVANGLGSAISSGIFNDKEYIAAWGYGNAIITWTVIYQNAQGVYIKSPIYASVTHDYGKTWSKGVEISGSAPFCVGAAGNTGCDQDQGSVPVVAADGSIYVSFYSLADVVIYRDHMLVVKIDPVTGQRVAGPFNAGLMIDGITDYPVSRSNRQTYQDSEFRTWSTGNLAADPIDAKHLAIAWSDMRNSPLPANPDPYQAKTDSDIIVTQSFDGGVTWTAPVAIRVPGDQFMPWAAFDALGRLRIGYYDRSYDPANHKYGYTIATELSSGSLTFNTVQVSTALSDPTQGVLWHSATTNPNFPYATGFIGDYSGIAVLPSGVAAFWTDLRDIACFSGACRSGMDAYFGTAP